MLNYTDGSPCESVSKRSAPLLNNLETREIVGGGDKKKSKDKDDDEGNDSDSKKKPSSNGKKKKSTIISMLCDRDPLAPTFALSFVGSLDECTYFFEGRSMAVCATANTSSGGSLNPSGVFGVIMVIAIAVYFVGGCVYNRAVLNQRGWQQIPNYSLWAGIFGFFRVRYALQSVYRRVLTVCRIWS